VNGCVRFRPVERALKQRLGVSLLLAALVGAPALAQRVPDLADLGRLEIDTIAVDDRLRTAWVWLPAGFDPAASWPVALVFHGGGGRGRSMMVTAGWREAADARGFIVVLPDGTAERPERPIRLRTRGQTWNDGSGRGTIGAVARDEDDIGFVDALVDRLLASYPIDPDAVFATGHSNGGSMTFHAARALGTRLAAIAPVAGSDFASDDPAPVGPLPVLYMTGTDDPLNPMDGGEVFIPPFAGPFTKPAVVPMVARWADAQDCASGPLSSFDLPGVTTTRWDECSGGVEVVLHAIEGHGHTFPGAERELPLFLVGPDTSQIQASEVILDFFAAVADQAD